MDHHDRVGEIQGHDLEFDAPIVFAIQTRRASAVAVAVAGTCSGTTESITDIARPTRGGGFDPHGSQENSTVRNRRFTWARRAVVGVGLAAVAAAAMIIPTLGSGDNETPAATARAAQVLNQAADKITPTDLHVGPGQYLFTRAHVWWGVTGSTFYALQENRIELWIPADWHDTWLQTRAFTGDLKWLKGTPADAGAAIEKKPDDPELRARCGKWFSDGADRCTQTPNSSSWEEPSKPFIQGLPTTAIGMYQRLYTDARQFADDRSGKDFAVYPSMFGLAVDGLKSGVLDASVRANLYRAMAKIPGVDITDDAVNLDGRTGVAFDFDHTGEEVIIEPTTGTFIGERTVVPSGEAKEYGLPAGTVIGSSAVYTGVADKIGQPPR